eukprot:2795139-Amphidinium_carterae.1
MVSQLLACLTCGASTSRRVGQLRKACTAELANARGLTQQRRRLQRGLHPNCRAPPDWLVHEVPLEEQAADDDRRPDYQL